MKYIVTPNKEGFIPKAAKQAIASELKSKAGKKIVINVDL